ITTTLYPIIIPKLQWWKWSGIDQPGGERGHWGWIPRYCLKGGEWDKAWRDSIRMLTVLCRDPEDPKRILGESTIQFMAHNQESTDAASGDMHIIVHDEPPMLAMWRESEARTMRVGGRLIVAMTWPDDPSIPVDWLNDEVYEPGIRGERDHAWFEMYTSDNPNLDQKAVASQAADWSTETKNVRLYGKSLRFSNRVHPLFTDQTQHWCFTCGRPEHAGENADAHGIEDKFRCTSCGGPHVAEFNHVREFEVSTRWPAIWLLDPHPRKPHMFLWVQVDPSDDLWVIAEGLNDGDPVEVKKHCDRVERELVLEVALRLIDPNMGLSPSSTKRERTWQLEFEEASLPTNLADDGEVGRKTLNTYLAPDLGRWQPRIHVHPRCKTLIHQMKRYVWADYKLASERAQLQVPRDKDDDFPSLLKYLMNSNPSFGMLHGIAQVIDRRRGGRPKALNSRQDRNRLAR
ncbi:MAG: hypothetical protein NUW01_01415, partial [Gemmatimonadaceae bacterium]|nr:hypothetical protein [Gemmatimonadaceae bacterium]